MYFKITILILIIAVLFDTKPFHGTPTRRNNTNSYTHYRGGGYGSVNTAFLMLKLYDFPVNYADVATHLKNNETDGKVSLKTLSDTAKKFGFDCIVKKLSPDQLTKMKGPSIVHLDSLSGNQSRYAIFLPSVKENKVLLIEGQTASVVDAPLDEFRLSWTGYAVVPASKFRWSTAFTAKILFVLFGYIAISFAYSFFKRRKTSTAKGI